MTYRPHCNRPHPTRGETIINNHRLDELLAKERAHDDYLEAIRTVRYRMSSAAKDYRQAMIDLSDAVVAVAGRRMD